MTLRPVFRRRALLALPLCLAALMTLLGACAEAPSGKTEGLEIAGTYVDEFGATQTVSSTIWSDSYGDVFHVLGYDNTQDYLLAQNDAANAYNPSLFSRFDWTHFNSDLYYCQAAYAAPDVSTAAATVPDRTDPSSGGCNSFAWTNLTPPAGP